METVAYIRTSTDKQDMQNQRHEILAYANQNKLYISRFIEVEMSSRRSSKDRLIDFILETFKPYDILIISELSRLGRSTSCVINTVNQLLAKKIQLIIIKQNMNFEEQTMQTKVMVTLFALFAELERDLISMRTKQGLSAKKAAGVKLGKPKGTIQKSKFDKNIDQIKELLQLGLSVRKIAKVLGYTNSLALNTYVNKRDLRNVSKECTKNS